MESYEQFMLDYSENKFQNEINTLKAKIARFRTWNEQLKTETVLLKQQAAKQAATEAAARARAAQEARVIGTWRTSGSDNKQWTTYPETFEIQRGGGGISRKTVLQPVPLRWYLSGNTFTVTYNRSGPTQFSGTLSGNTFKCTSYGGSASLPYTFIR